MNISFNHVSLGFEKLLNNNKSINFILGYVGLRKAPDYEIDVNGGYVTLGLKYYLNRGKKLNGFYNNPELCFVYLGNKYFVTELSQNNRYEEKNYFIEKYIFGFMNNFGYQTSIIKNRLLFDVYIGIGSTLDSEIDKKNYYYSKSSFFVSKFGFRTRLTTNLGFNIAYVFGKK